MKIHTDTLTFRDFLDAFATSPGVEYGRLTIQGSRSRQKAFDLTLVSDGQPDKDGTPRHRRPNSGVRGAGEAFAASYADWGRVLAHLFEVDPEALAGPYKGAADFHAQTKGAFVPTAV